MSPTDLEAKRYKGDFTTKLGTIINFSIIFGLSIRMKRNVSITVP